MRTTLAKNSFDFWRSAYAYKQKYLFQAINHGTQYNQQNAYNCPSILIKYRIDIIVLWNWGQVPFNAEIIIHVLLTMC